ncbi:MurR/RpiR family transcriptional regulator [Desulfovibrio sp. OttesenSCG-928-O18]|nr:MurR/RpiR family transcriptional regulator [Desulfovibrio sp. OttesenSCG-928-O18]
MDETIFVRINERHGKLSRVFRNIADYILKNYMTVPFLSISELSRAMDVSAASITRFCKEMGYTGYPEFQKSIQRIAQNEMIPMREIKNSVAAEFRDDEILQTTIDLNIENLRYTYSEHLQENFDRAVEIITSARRVYVIGLRTTYSPAYYLYSMLSGFMDNVILLKTGVEDMYDHIMNINENDVLVAISFEKYTRATHQVADFFKRHGSRLIALTDFQVSPLATNADAVLIAKNTSTTFSFVSAMTILNAVITAVGRHNKNETLEMLKKKQALLLEQGVHL